MTTATKITYGVGAFGYGCVNQMLGNFLMFFGTGVLGLPGTLMGLALGLSTGWDAITDPIVGTLSDRLRTRFGRRHLLMAVGCLGVAGLNLLIWRIDPSWGTLHKFGAVLGCLLLMETFNTTFSTPYSALGLDMAGSYHERTGIQSCKTAFQTAALLVPSLLMVLVLRPTDYVTINSTARGYQIISVITSSLCLLCGGRTIWGTRRFRTSAPRNAAEQPPLRRALGTILGDRNNRYLIAAYAVALSASAFLTTLGLHLFTYTFCFTSTQIPVVMGCLVLGVIVGQPLWCAVSRRYGKRATVLAALVVVLLGACAFAVVLAWRWWLGRGVCLALVAGVILWLSVGLGCIYSLPLSMFADRLDASTTALGTGLLTFCTKATNALVTLLVGVILDVLGFQSGVAVQSLFVSTALGWVLIAGVVGAALGAFGLFSRYHDQNPAECGIITR